MTDNPIYISHEHPGRVLITHRIEVTTQEETLMEVGFIAVVWSIFLDIKNIHIFEHFCHLTYNLIIWIIFGVVLLLRLVLYLKYALKDHEFGSEHTYLNKLTGLMVFGIALIINTAAAVPYCYTAVWIAFVAVVYELFIRTRIIDRI